MRKEKAEHDGGHGRVVMSQRHVSAAWKHGASRRSRNAAAKASWLSHVVESACRHKDKDSEAVIQQEAADTEAQEREGPLQRQNPFRLEAFA